MNVDTANPTMEFPVSSYGVVLYVPISKTMHLTRNSVEIRHPANAVALYGSDAVTL